MFGFDPALWDRDAGNESEIVGLRERPPHERLVAAVRNPACKRTRFCKIETGVVTLLGHKKRCGQMLFEVYVFPKLAQMIV